MTIKRRSGHPADATADLLARYYHRVDVVACAAPVPQVWSVALDLPADVAIHDARRDLPAVRRG